MSCTKLCLLIRDLTDMTNSMSSRSFSGCPTLVLMVANFDSKRQCMELMSDESAKCISSRVSNVPHTPLWCLFATFHCIGKLIELLHNVSVLFQQEHALFNLPPVFTNCSFLFRSEQSQSGTLFLICCSILCPQHIPQREKSDHT
jgi:hypothetical protein